MSKAKLRCCASCEWIFIAGTPDTGCPKCGFGHYSARYVHGQRAYRYARTQKPWFDRKMSATAVKLQREIDAAAPKPVPMLDFK